ncbi:uncharacterized protein LOC129869864 [Solanum dulcamara]|uniref:uncharacterized protein LOC129869864 n=1 Tax=Solanum dulcamara TaxID=45834 RepID=UPI002484EFA7|nr:uncharacterized protein LOC129869864 [Solanum dulcamara]
MSVEDMLKQIMMDQAKLSADVRQNQLATQSLGKQLGQLASECCEYHSGLPLIELAPKIKLAEVKGKDRVGDEGEFSRPRAVEEPKTKPPSPFPQKFKKKKKDECFAKFIDLLKQAEYETVALTEEYSSRILNKVKLPTKQKDLQSFTVQVTIERCVNARGLCDLGAGINLIPTSMFNKLGFRNPKPTIILLQLADRSVAKSDRVIKDVLV